MTTLLFQLFGLFYCLVLPGLLFTWGRRGSKAILLAESFSVALLVVPMLCFCVAWLLGTNINIPLVFGVASGLNIILLCRVLLARRARSKTFAKPVQQGAPLILAIHEDSNANAALLCGQDIVGAVAEERLTRVKFQAGFPRHSIAEVLRIGGATLADVHYIVAGNRLHFLPRLLGSWAIEGEHDLLGVRHKAYLTLQDWLCSHEGVAARVETLNRLILRSRFGRDVPLIDHHTAHAYSAYLTSPFQEALAVTLDNFGDGWSGKVFACRGGRLRLLWGVSASDSPGQFYGEIAQFLGIHVLNAGKVTGLAARGDPRPAYPIMERLFRLEEDDHRFVLYPLWKKRWNKGPWRELKSFSPQDVAAAAQKRLEDLVVAFVRRALRETKDRYLVLAGGVFANVLLNQRLWNLPEVEGIFIHPAMSDQGIAVGAALAYLAETVGASPKPIEHVFLGPEYTDEELGQALEAAKIRFERPKDIEARVAELIVMGKVVGRFTGRLEYGPRALGNRSILYHTLDPSVNQWLNERLERSETMPFAPATLAEFAPLCYDDYGPGAAHTARFMTITFRCTEKMQRLSPAVVHLDKTARPQCVHEDTTPGFYRILRLVYEKSGVPSVLNTSFNLHGEPIVCRPEEAIRLFCEKRVDALALGPFLAEHK